MRYCGSMSRIDLIRAVPGLISATVPSPPACLPSRTRVLRPSAIVVVLPCGGRAVSLDEQDPGPEPGEQVLVVFGERVLVERFDLGDVGRGLVGVLLAQVGEPQLAGVPPGRDRIPVRAHQLLALADERAGQVLALGPGLDVGLRGRLLRAAGPDERGIIGAGGGGGSGV